MQRVRMVLLLFQVVVVTLFLSMALALGGVGVQAEEDTVLGEPQVAGDALAPAGSPAAGSPAAGGPPRAWLPAVFNDISAEEQRVVELVNAERAQARCPAVRVNRTLMQVAEAHSRDMAQSDFFNHSSLDGSSPFDRMRAAGYRYSRASENIAAGYATPEAVMNGWMLSSGHRANILDCSVTEIGVGYYYHSPDPGRVTYRHYWTQDFGCP